MTSPATQRTQGEVQVAYLYCVSHLAHLGDRSALKFKRAFPTYESWVQLASSERDEAAKTALGKASQVLVTNFDSLLERAVADVKSHERQGIRVLPIDSGQYPPLLKQIVDAPLILFVKGSIDALVDASNVAVIGTRDATQNGEKVASKVAKWFAEQGWCVVSGLAKGIDSAAHRGTLDVRGRTTAVMATPLNKVYPAENKQLANEILDGGGCWISELPVGGTFHRSSFVQRDRIQSGLSVAVIPVQTDVEGGTMHTVRYAEQQGRLVLCPRPIEAEQSAKQYAGVRKLIESRRAVPFSSTEYTTILASLIECRNTLLKGVASKPDAGITERERIPEETIQPTNAPETAGVQGTVVGAESGQKPKRKKRPRLQINLGFVEETTSKPKRVIGKRERESQIRHLEQLMDEVRDAKRHDGQPISNADDVRLWLEAKVKALQQSKPRTERLEDEQK